MHGDRGLVRARPVDRPRGLVLGVAVALVTAACTSSSDAASPMGASGSGSASGATATVATVTTIPQPAVPAHIPVAPESERVDLTMPTFSDPTNITNPLFPVSLQESVLMLGHVDGKPFRTEVTLLPETQIIEWEGQRVETLVSQYNAFLDGRIEEVAYDYYAQADDGSVWYFGEDVFDFRDGAIVVTEGTWLAGRDGPAAMIMPGDPQVGDVYRTENAPGFVFEEVTVRSVDETLDGPIGPIEGGTPRRRAAQRREDRAEGLRPRVRRVLHGRRRGRRGPCARGPDGRSDRAAPGRAHDPVERRARDLRRGRVGGLGGGVRDAPRRWRPPGRPTEPATCRG